MAYNKVIYGGNTLIDLTDLDVTAGDVVSGVNFIMADGTKAVGTITIPTKTSELVNDSGFITKSAFAVEEVSVDWTATGSANSSATKSPYTVTHPNTDWEVLGIVGWDLGGSGIATIRVLKVAINGNGDIYIYGHNDNSSNRTLTMTCRVLYIHK